MSVSVDFLKRATALGLQSSSLPEWLDEIESLRQQLAVREKQIVMLREAIDRQPYTMDKQVCEALAATEADLGQYILCEKEPFCYLTQTSSERNPPHGWSVTFSSGEVHLHRPRRPE